jgi:hypothetical protein
MFLLLGKTDFPMDLFPTEITYMKYESGDMKFSVKLGLDDIRNLSVFIEKNKHDWSSGFRGYANSQVFYSEKMKINCIDNGVIVNFMDENGNKFQSLSKFHALFYKSTDKLRHPVQPHNKRFE